MVDRPVKQLTVRELFVDTERLTRELIEHLEHGFIPRTHGLRRVTRHGRPGPETPTVEDVTIRAHSARVLESENFTEQLYEKLSVYFTTIDEDVSRIVTEG